MNANSLKKDLLNNLESSNGAPDVDSLTKFEHDDFSTEMSQPSSQGYCLPGLQMNEGKHSSCEYSFLTSDISLEDHLGKSVYTEQDFDMVKPSLNCSTISTDYSDLGGSSPDINKKPRKSATRSGSKNSANTPETTPCTLNTRSVKKIWEKKDYDELVELAIKHRNNWKRIAKVLLRTKNLKVNPKKDSAGSK